MGHKRNIAVIGLGYVGLPVAVAFARSGASVIGFDIDRRRVDDLRGGKDRTLEVPSADLNAAGVHFEHDPKRLADADFYIFRDRSADAMLPWDIIDGGMKTSFFQSEFEKGLREEWTLPPKRAKENLRLLPLLP